MTTIVFFVTLFSHMSKPTSLFLGRFQPFHNGHLLVIEGMTKVSGKIIIAIGSANEQGTDLNPYSAQDRKEMMQRALQAKDLIPMFDINFIEVPDQKSDAQWADHVLQLAGSVDKLWTGNEEIKKHFEGKVEIQPIKEVPGISGTKIRDMIKNGGDWQEKVPPEVFSFIKEKERQW